MMPLAALALALVLAAPLVTIVPVAVANETVPTRPSG